MIQISPVERLLLANQFRILSKLDEEYAKYNDLEDKIHILEKGLEGAYGEVLGELAEQTMSAEEMRFVNDVLLMMSAVLEFEDGLEDYRLDRVRQVGFDGNNEPRQLSYAEYLFNNPRNRFEGVTDVVNSHSPTLIWYKGMLEAFHEESQLGAFNRESAKRVLDAGRLQIGHSRIK